MSTVARTLGSGPCNNAGGLGTFDVTDLVRLRRFLMLGAEGGTYYASSQKLTLENAAAVARMLAGGEGATVVAEALDVSVTGRAAKQSPTLFVLAMAARLGDPTTRKAAYTALPKVARTPTMLFEWISYSQAMGEGSGWGRGLRRAVAVIYTAKAPKSLAYWVTKYRSREGWTHRDVLRLAHVKPSSDGQQLVLNYAVKDALVGLEGDESAEAAAARAFLAGVEQARRSEDPAEMVALIAEHGLAREHVPSPLLGSVEVWRALLNANMPMTAMMRNLAKMTSIELLKPLSAETATVCAKLRDPAALRRARVHPFSVLTALKTYERGAGIKGSLTWQPIPEVTKALDDAFYAAFSHVLPTGKRFVIAMDVSGSMTCGDVNGSPGISPRVAAAAMAMATMRTEPRTHPLAFTSTLVPLRINAKMSLDEVVRECNSLPFGGTDCAQPMLWAMENKVKADVFIVYTDCETWAGSVSPADALRRYRQKTGIDARLIVVAMTSGGFTLADPSDAGMLDVVGFDASAPQIIRDFVMGAHGTAATTTAAAASG